MDFSKINLKLTQLISFLLLCRFLLGYSEVYQFPLLVVLCANLKISNILRVFNDFKKLNLFKYVLDYIVLAQNLFISVSFSIVLLRSKKCASHFDREPPNQNKQFEETNHVSTRYHLDSQWYLKAGSDQVWLWFVCKNDLGNFCFRTNGEIIRNKTFSS